MFTVSLYPRLHEGHHILVGFQNRYFPLLGSVDHDGLVDPCIIGALVMVAIQ